MKNVLRLTVIFAIVLGLASARQPTKVARDLQGLEPDAQVDVIVRFKQHTQRAGLARSRERLRGKLERKGANRTRLLEAVNGSVYRMKAKHLAELANDPDVAYITPDREVSGTIDNIHASVNGYPLIDYYNQVLHQGKAWGMGIAFLDSGIDDAHPNFNDYMSSDSRIVYRRSYVGGGTGDAYGHGTHVIGIATGMDNATINVGASRNFWGVVPDAHILSLKVLDANGKGTDSGVIAAIDKVISLKNTYNIRVMNLSLGRPVFESYKDDPLCQAVERAWKAGIVVVVAAGNDGRDNSFQTKGYGTIASPGNDPYVITVGAVNHKQDMWRGNDVITTYSSKGPTPIDHVVKPDLVAPGNRIVSYLAPGANLPGQYPANRPPTSMYLSGGSSSPSPHFYTLSGTSMAAPVVAGVAALLIDKDPSLTPDQVKAKLMKTAWRGFPDETWIYDPTTYTWHHAQHDLFTVGAGMVDAWAAYNNHEKPTGSAASPIVYYDSGSDKVKLLFESPDGESILWGRDSNWGSSILWGRNVTGNSVLWGRSILWGRSTADGFSILWGRESPYSESILWGRDVEAVNVLIHGEE